MVVAPRGRAQGFRPRHASQMGRGSTLCPEPGVRRGTSVVRSAIKARSSSLNTAPIWAMDRPWGVARSICWAMATRPTCRSGSATGGRSARRHPGPGGPYGRPQRRLPSDAGSPAGGRYGSLQGAQQRAWSRHALLPDDLDQLGAHGLAPGPDPGFEQVGGRFGHLSSKSYKRLVLRS